MSYEHLADLHTALIDANNGYYKAIEKADDGKVKALFEDMLALHTRAHADLHYTLSSAGQKPDDSGSFMSTIHKAAISVRATFTGIDEDALPAFADGEDRLGEQYDTAIEDETEPSTKAMLQSHKAAHQAMLTRMRQLSDTSGTV